MSTEITDSTDSTDSSDSTATTIRTDAGRIVVGVDGSDASKDALRWAYRQATFAGAELVVVGVWSYVTMSYPTMSGYVPAVNDLDLETDTRLFVERLVKEVLDDAPVRIVVTEGHPAEVLTRFSESADLVVVGSRGHGGFVGALVGSVSQHVVSHASCPVVVVRHPKQAAR